MKKLYRLWFPQVEVHGSCFDKICPKCQKKIADKLADGFVLPTTVSIDTSIGLSIQFGCSLQSLPLCKTCETTFKEWFNKADHVEFTNEPIELWTNNIEE